jgi:hypothetical protein
MSSVSGTSTEPIRSWETIPGIRFMDYENEKQLEAVMSLVGRDLSEPYSSMYVYILVCATV